MTPLVRASKPRSHENDCVHPTLIGARAFDLLMAVVENRDRVVRKRELLDLV